MTGASAQMAAARDTVLVGGGGHACVVADMLASLGRRVRGFVAPSRGARLDGMAWLGGDDVLERLAPGTTDIALGIGSTGDAALRRGIFDILVRRGHAFPPLVHPSAHLARSVSLGAGAQVMLGAAVQAGVVLDANSIVNTGAIVDHDCHIGAHAHVAPGAVLCGDVRVGDGAHVGAGARILQGVRVGATALIGAGAVVLCDVPQGVRVAGVPAREMRP